MHRACVSLSLVYNINFQPFLPCNADHDDPLLHLQCRAVYEIIRAGAAVPGLEAMASLQLLAAKQASRRFATWAVA